MARTFSRGFTMIELLLVIAVIAVLATIAYPVFIGILERARVVKDMNNLRQIGIATQLYMNDNEGVLPGSATVTWMSQLNPKYVSAWGIFQSPFDTRSPSEAGTAAPVSPISYGINLNVYPNNVAISADKITKPTVFILFAPAQAAGGTVTFSGLATTGAPGVTVLAAGGAAGGTHSTRTKINALFADLHLENMEWTTFTNTTPSATDPSADLRWTPYLPYP
jgi:prepilin-type N-terminal cleavage/methylation domain-containing protein